jgi:hypothetical protein
MFSVREKKAFFLMNNELYLQQLRRQYIQAGEDYLRAIKGSRSRSEIRDITLHIHSLLTEIRAVEEDIRRIPGYIAA